MEKRIKKSLHDKSAIKRDSKKEGNEGGKKSDSVIPLIQKGCK